MDPETIASLIEPYIAGAPGDTDWQRIHAQLATYLDLILKWNARTNLTAIRTPEEIVRRHFGESLFVGSHLGDCATLLDFGSGAGFPGIPVQLLRPELAVTLAESQGKKAAFLREAIRTLELPTEVWAGRVESMPPARRFDTVVLRAVDDMSSALEEAGQRASRQILILTTSLQPLPPALTQNFRVEETEPLPESTNGIVLTVRRI